MPSPLAELPVGHTGRPAVWISLAFAKCLLSFESQQSFGIIWFERLDSKCLGHRMLSICKSQNISSKRIGLKFYWTTIKWFPFDNLDFFVLCKVILLYKVRFILSLSFIKTVSMYPMDTVQLMDFQAHAHKPISESEIRSQSKSGDLTQIAESYNAYVRWRNRDFSRKTRPDNRFKKSRTK